MPTATRRTCRTRGIGRTIRGLYKSKPNLVRPTQSAARRPFQNHRSPRSLGGFAGGRDRRRSGDLPLFRRSLCLLSYPTRWRGDPKASPTQTPSPRRGCGGPDEI